MKKHFIAIVFLSLSVMFSCSMPYEFSQDLSDLEQLQIEIVNLETEMGDHEGSPYNDEDVTVINVVENDQKENFISEFKKIKSYQPNTGDRIDCISGKAIRIIYPNGDIELITHYGTATVKDGEIHNSTTTFDSDDFSELLDRYS